MDESLRELGPVPDDLERSLEGYLGSSRITAARADVLLAALEDDVTAFEERWKNAPGPAPVAEEPQLPRVSLMPAAQPAAVFEEPIPPSGLTEKPPQVAAAAATDSEDTTSTPLDEGFEILVDDDVMSLELEDEVRSAHRR